MDVHKWTQCAHGVDLRERIEETTLLIRGESAVILADAEAVVVVVAGGRRLVVFLARFEAHVVKGGRHVARRIFRRVGPVDAMVGIARIVRSCVSVDRRTLIVWSVIRLDVRLVALVLVFLVAFGFCHGFAPISCCPIGLGLIERRTILSFPSTSGRVTRGGLLVPAVFIFRSS